MDVNFYDKWCGNSNNSEISVCEITLRKFTIKSVKF